MLIKDSQLLVTKIRKNFIGIIWADGPSKKSLLTNSNNNLTLIKV